MSITATYTANNGSLGSTIQVNGSGSVTTDFMKVAGFPNINFSTTSTTAWGNVRMRVAMALDNTGSMADNGKISALQNRRPNGDLIDQLSALAKNPGDVYISDRSVRQGRQRRRQQLQPDLDRLDRLGRGERNQRLHSHNSRGSCTSYYLDAGEPQHLDRLRRPTAPKTTTP